MTAEERARDAVEACKRGHTKFVYCTGCVVDAIRAAAAEERAAVLRWVKSHKGGQKTCEACGCWNLVDNIIDGIEHEDHVAAAHRAGEAG